MTPENETPATDLFLALLIKESGGKATIKEKTFIGMESMFEIEVRKELDGDVVLTLIEGLEEVNTARAKRSLVVP